MSERPTSDTNGQDAPVDAAWRRSSHEEPSPAVDEAIRAAARRRVVAGPAGDVRAGKSPGRFAARWRRSTRWLPVAAAAGVAVLAFGLLRWLPVEQQVAPSAPASPAAKAETASDNAARESTPVPTAPRADTAPLVDEPASIMRGEEAAPARPPADFAAQQKQVQPPPAQEQRALPTVSAPTGARAAAEQSAHTQDAGARAPAQETVSVTSAQSAARQDTTEQLRVEEIAQLHAAGRLDDAGAALRELRRTDPHADERLPQELRSWAATVRD